MRNYNIESKSVHGKKQFASNYFFLLLSVRQYKKNQIVCHQASGNCDMKAA